MNQYGVPLRYFYAFLLETRLAELRQSLAKKSWTCLSLVALGGGLLGAPLATAVQALPLQNEAEVTHVEPAIAPLLADGIYFYGEATTPNQLGHSYMVFEAVGQQVTGAVYMPSSSFDCFRGEITPAALNLEITNSYTQEVYNYAIATLPSDPVVSAAGNVLTPLALSGLYDLGAASAEELALLQICQSDFQREAELEI
ncbi:MAG: hypothetical protein HC812_12330 [Leptolyngbya sp. RL_3_1]|nr:hypothetical protein [Leptolyngbya sp. RL_3_1]